MFATDIEVLLGHRVGHRLDAGAGDGPVGQAQGRCVALEVFGKTVVPGVHRLARTITDGMQSTQPTSTPLAIRASSLMGRAITIGSAVVGVLNALDGVAYFGLTTGMNPIQVLQYIASGALGPRALEGGLATAGLGALIHFALAYGFTGAFVLAWSRSGAIRHNGVAAGLAWVPPSGHS